MYKLTPVTIQISVNSGVKFKLPKSDFEEHVNLFFGKWNEVGMRSIKEILFVNEEMVMQR
jgi:hypothetical protein